MIRIQYDSNLMGYMSLFETLTQTKLKDCITGEKLIFIVEEGQIGKAIGKKGINVKKLEQALNKRIRIAEYSSDVLQFVKNLIYPLQVKDIRKEDNCIMVCADNTNTRSLLIGRERKNVNELKGIVKRYFNIDDIKVR
jgi:N utilization substance protein A